MHLALLSDEGLLLVIRWIHLLTGSTWIGILYYFNFVQGEFFKEASPEIKNVTTLKLVPRALWWLKWGATLTLVSGILLILKTVNTGIPIKSSWGVLIILGGFLGFLMWFNIWFVICPAHKGVAASATEVLAGRLPLPEAVEQSRRSMVASRTNVLFSFPLLFFMGASRYLLLERNFSEMNYRFLIVTVGCILLLLELNALKGRTGPYTSVKGVIACGILLTALLYLVIEITTKT